MTTRLTAILHMHILSARRFQYNRLKTSRLLLAVLLAISIILGQAPQLAVSAPAKQVTEVQLYLPLALKEYPIRNIYGVTMETLTESYGLSPLAAAGTTWTRRVLSWATVENVENARNWDPGLESELAAAAAKNIRVILVVEHTPAWALKPGFACGAVASNKLPALARFVSDSVKRYSQYPYSVAYWELWNEPDAAGLLGCWGDPSDPLYFGGAYYGSMLASVYPSIKAANSSAQVLVGGLLLDCDPSAPPAGSNCVTSNFLKGILATGGGAYFDGVSFHAYDFYTGPGTYNNPNWHTSTNTTGPALIAKAAYLRGLLTAYNFPQKYLISTENAIFYGPNNPTPLCSASVPPDFELTKAYYLVHAFTAAQAEGLIGNVWYAAIANRCVSLFETNLTPKPAFRTYEFMRSRLQSAVFKRKITEYAGVRGYEFRRENRTVWVLWSQNGQPHTIQLPSTPLEVYRIGDDGAPVTEAAASTVTISIAPQVIEYIP